MRPLVSILIPAYNAASLIGETIKSALAQRWPEKEVIVVDDGSTDETLAVAKRFASETVSVVTQRNQGASAARNRAFEVSRGEYIQWLDADDLLAFDKIERQMAAAQECASRRTLISSGWAFFMHRQSRAELQPSALWCDLAPVEWLLCKMSGNLHMQTATWLVSRELTEAAGPWDTRLSLDDDGEYFCRVLLASQGTKFVEGGTTYYRVSGFDSLSSVDGSDRKLESQFLSMQLHVRYLRSLEDSERTRAACLNYLRTWLIYFYPRRMDLVQQLEQLAADCGGRLEPPRLPRKYAWIQKAFGWNAAKRVQMTYNRHKSAVLRSLDSAMTRIGGRGAR